MDTQATDSAQRRVGPVRTTGSRIGSAVPAGVAILLYALLVDAAVETVWSGAPVRWWVLAAVVLYLGRHRRGVALVAAVVVAIHLVRSGDGDLLRAAGARGCFGLDRRGTKRWRAHARHGHSNHADRPGRVGGSDLERNPPQDGTAAAMGEGGERRGGWVPGTGSPPSLSPSGAAPDSKSCSTGSASGRRFRDGCRAVALVPWRSWRLPPFSRHCTRRAPGSCHGAARPGAGGPWPWPSAYR